MQSCNSLHFSSKTGQMCLHFPVHMPACHGGKKRYPSRVSPDVQTSEGAASNALVRWTNTICSSFLEANRPMANTMTPTVPLYLMEIKLRYYFKNNMVSAT